MENKISHEGVIDSIGKSLVRVRIFQAAACAACKVASQCNTAEAKEKIIDVPVDDVSRWQVGQAVVVSTKGSTAGMAATIAFGIPLLLMLVVLLSTLSAGASEGTAAVAMLGVTAAYYLVIWLFRSRLARSISFYIEEEH